MEFLLLWVDELDDAVGALRHLAPQILGFLTATALFVATGAALVLAPQVTVAIAAVAGSAAILEIARRRLTRLADQRDSR
jgi:hypothetical protein